VAASAAPDIEADVEAIRNRRDLAETQRDKLTTIVASVKQQY
jgi:hypothetical protein